MDLRQLRALVAVVDEGTFTDAAIRLGVSQASVSRGVAALERSLGSRVLRRSTREVSVTVVGSRVLRHARRVLDEVAALQRAAVESGELRLGYAWAALGRHTTEVQRSWAARHPGNELVLIQSNTRTAGLVEGLADVAVLRQPLEDARFQVVLVGVEARYAALPSTDPLSRRRALRLRDVAQRPVVLGAVTGTTTEQLWPAGERPSELRSANGVDEWLTQIAAGRAVGVTTEATARQHPRPGVVYRPVRDAPPLPVSLAWRADDPPARVQELVALVCDAYGAPGLRAG